jgi:hypothetical protein
MLDKLIDFMAKLNIKRSWSIGRIFFIYDTLE